MPRSVKKGPYVPKCLRKKIAAEQGSRSSRPIKTYKRSSVIIPDMVGLHIAVHNGIVFVPIYITARMVGMKLGEFSMTRKFSMHAGDRKGKK
jgi:small subunit ribosomal protein S19